jgi:F-type H+-transporting ATPase subunit a
VNGLNSLVLSEGITFHAPSITEFFPAAIFFEGTPFEMNRIMIIRMIMVVALIIIFWLGTRNMKLIPGRFQGAIEMALDLVRVNIAEDLLGKKDGRCRKREQCFFHRINLAS